MLLLIKILNYFVIDITVYDNIWTVKITNIYYHIIIIVFVLIFLTYNT